MFKTNYEKIPEDIQADYVNIGEYGLLKCVRKISERTHGKFKKELFEEIQNQGRGISKPLGGIWTTPIKAKGETWERFLLENFREDPKFKWEIKIKEDSKILIIHSKEDVKKNIKFNNIGLDFEELTKTWDAIWLTEQGRISTHRGDIRTELYAWDVETCLLLNTNCIKSIK